MLPVTQKHAVAILLALACAAFGVFSLSPNLLLLLTHNTRLVSSTRCRSSRQSLR